MGSLQSSSFSTFEQTKLILEIFTMADIKITDLKAAGSDLFEDPNSVMTDVSDSELSVNGGCVSYYYSCYSGCGYGYHGYGGGSSSSKSSKSSKKSSKSSKSKSYRYW